MRRIILLRHGKPDVELKGIVRSKDLGALSRAYDASGIDGGPPEKVLTALKGCRVVVCSHLERSLQSASALGFSGPHLKDPLFCEAAIPHFGGGTVSLPVSVWVVVLRLLWLVGFSRNGESFDGARARAGQAAARLVELAEEHQQVLLVGHGFINRFIASELKRCGWLGPARPGRRFWEYGVYEKVSA